MAYFGVLLTCAIFVLFQGFDVVIAKSTTAKTYTTEVTGDWLLMLTEQAYGRQRDWSDVQKPWVPTFDTFNMKTHKLRSILGQYQSVSWRSQLETLGEPTTTTTTPTAEIPSDEEPEADVDELKA